MIATVALSDEKSAKASLRAEAIAARDSISPDIKKIKDSAIKKNLFQTGEFINSNSVMFFASVRSEPDTLTMITVALTMNKTVVLPRVDLKTRQLQPYVVADVSELIPGYMNILEPHPQRSKPVSIAAIDMIVMPGLAFDKSGGRLGYGGGYYDRFIGTADNTQHPVLAAIAYAQQIVERVPVMNYDVLVDMIVTELGVFDCRGARE
ncbi:MAG: 5-formyltetrahydrofolate cyclo-ligase [Nitrospirae bacterium]|nr:5-formyltetrahydrofolate cyclo-ligase [Nitrospirota bacterium]